MRSPNNWVTQSLKDWGMQAQSGFASGVHNSEGNGVIHLRPMNINRLGKLDFETVKSVVDVSARRIQKGDILFNNTNSAELVGKTAIVDVEGEFAFSNHMTRLRFPANQVVHKYMAILLHSFWMSGYFKQICSNHVNQASVSIKKLEQVEVSLPNIEEQYKIVGLLEDHFSHLDAALADIKQAMIKSSLFRQSLLNSVFNGKGFDSVHLGTCIELIMGQAPPGTTCNKNGEGTPFVKVGEFAKLHPNIEEWTTKPLRLAKEGDVLICVVGATVGKINLGIDCAIGRSVAAIRPKNTLLQKYLYFFLELKMQEIRGQSKGSAQGVITKEYINSIQIPLPELNVQQEILDLLESNFSQIEKSMEVSYGIEREIHSLRRSLLQAAFTGQLTKEV